MAYVMSPSGLMTFRQCPLKFHGTYIDKSIPWKDSPSKARGTQVHSGLETAVNKGWDKMPMVDNQFDSGYARGIVNGLRALADCGYQVFTEKELAITKAGAPCDWWAPDAFLRAKADVLMLPPDNSKPVILGDWKTGRKWDIDSFQLRTEAFLCHFIYGVPSVRYAYWYVDQGETVDATVNLSTTLADVQDVIDTMTEVRMAIKNNYFPAQRNKFCRFCPKEGTVECNEVIPF